MLYITIACWLANGQYVEPRGHYSKWGHCDKQTEYFETILFPSYGNKHPLCWCRQGSAPAPVKKTIRYDDDRKAPD
jgi:hypothetical protein